MGSAWNQLEQMLTCAICLDKFKNPRLLPCQHSFCGDACMDGLVDYARRQIKCPECRAEHRIPYQGVQSLPLNVTLIRFLELHARITGEEPEPVPTFMEKCGICGEKVEGVQRCSHCEKKVCPECKEAHIDLLRREINRINGQSRRSVSKIGEFTEVLKKAEERLHANHSSVRREIEDSCKRLIDDLQSKQRRLLEDVDSYVEQEQKTIDKLKVSVTDELDVLESNLKLADEKLTSSKFQWNDAELSECKEIYNKAMEFVRLFDPDIGDFTRKIRFILIPEFETLRRRLCELGELKFAETAQSLIANSFQYCNATGSVAMELCQAAANASSQLPSAGYGLAHSNSNTNIDSQLARLQASQAGAGVSGQMLELPNALMRSQSDHRLASQFQARMKQQEAAAAASAKNNAASRYGRQSEFEQDSLRSRYAPPRTGATSAKDYSSDLLRDWPRPSDNDDALSSLGSSIQFKSAFMRRKEKERQQAYGAYGAPADLDDDDLTSEASYGGSLSAGGRNVRFYDQQLDAQQQAALAAKSLGPKVFDCKEVMHAPFSGVPKLEECPQFQTRLHQLAAKAVVDKKHAEEEGRRDKDLVESARAAMTKASERIQRQMSEDELEKQKQANKTLEQQQRGPTPNSVLDQPASRPRDSPARDSRSTSTTAPISGTGALTTQSSEATGRALASESTSQLQATTNSGSASSSPATPTSTSALPGGRRSLYGQAVTERSKRQLSSAIQDAANYTSRRRSSLVRDQASESQEQSQEVGAEAQQAVSNSSSSVSATASPPGSSSGAVRKRALRSTGRSLSKQSSSERQQSLDAGASPSATTRRRRLLRGESSRQESVDSSATTATSATTSGPTTNTERSNQPKNYSIGSGGGEPSLDQDDERSSLASRRAHQDSPVGSGGRLYAGRQATSTTTDEEDDDDDDDDGEANDSSKNTGTIRKAAKLRQQSTTSSVASRHRYAGSKSRDDSPDEPNSVEDEEAGGDDEESTSDKRAGGNRRSREFLPSAMNKLLDRSAQIRRDSQEQRTRGDSPQRSSGGSPMSSEARQSAYSAYSRPSSGVSAIRQRLGYQRSQSIRDQDEEATTSSQSLYTTASSQASGRRSSNEDELHLSSSSSGRRPSTGGSSTDRTVIPSRLDRDASDRTDSARSTTAATTTGRYSSGRRDSTGDDGGGYTSRFLARSRTSAALSSGRNRDYNSEREHPYESSRNAASSSNQDSPRSYLSSRDRFMQSVGSSGASGSSSSAAASNASAASSSGYSRQAGSSAGGIKTHSEYLRNKYSRRGSSNSSSNSSNLLSRSRSSHLFSHHDSSNYSTKGSQDSAEDEDDDEGQDLGRRRRASGASGTTGSRRSSLLDSTSSLDRGSGGVKSPIYSPKGRMLFKLGSRGSEPGNFTWPRGVAVGSLGSIIGGREIVVADSSNHRVQIFDSTGRFMNEFGSYGSAEGEFDCLAGVALNRRQKQYVVSDRYNHRIQLFDASGRFVRAFGEMGKEQGKFNLPWGVACDSTSGSIYVCDKENHRVQVFDSSGQYLSKFGSGGAQAGQLQHPHYIAVGYGKVVLTDTNNHRVQLFDLSGRMIKMLGKEGSAPGQFKFPRGVAMDDQGHLIVGDSGNNRLQIFTPEGAFIKAIGTWGSSDGEFKGIEGVAADSSSSNIFVCDRENHRIQVF